jgi:hypothetical protein
LQHIHVLVVGSRLLRDIIEQIAVDHPDIEVLASVPAHTSLDEALSEGQATVLICTREDAPSASQVDDLLRKYPLLRVLVLERTRGGSVLCELKPHRRVLGEVGPDGLIAVIRNDADSRGGS